MYHLRKTKYNETLVTNNIKIIVSNVRTYICMFRVHK